MSDSSLLDFVISIGEPVFASKALDYVRRQVAVDHVSLFVLDHEFVPHFLGAASRAAEQTALLAGRIYERAMFYRHDPNSQHISQSPVGELMIFRQRASDIRDAQYRDRLYRRFGLLERISVIRAVHGRWFVFNVYRNVASGPFTDADLDDLVKLGPLLVTCEAKHASLAAPHLLDEPVAKSRAYLESVLKSMEPRLTKRELEVCALALADKTVAEIAKLLGVGQSTVATLRRRAYAKLGITRLSGLFALCISRISR